MGFLFSPRPSGWLAWIPGLLYTIAALLDFVDGYLARRLDQGTRLGEILDMNFDGLGVLTATLLVVQYRQVPLWYLLVGLARYIFLFGLWIRRRLGLEIFALPPDPSRRAQAGLQMGYIFVMLWPVFSPPGTHFAAILFSLPFLSGFLWDWLTVSGVVNRPVSARRWEVRLSSLRRFAVTWLPIVFRLGVAALAWVMSTGWQIAGESRQDLFFRAENGVNGWLVLLEWVVWGFIVGGVAGRISAIVGLCLLGVHQIHSPLMIEQYWLALLYAGILYFGTGKLSLWKPEDWLIYQRAGEKTGLQGAARQKTKGEV
jgi:CDP-diacylglycerol--glycerol-3-phosphate 3-phosphatidyltransferase